MSGGLAFVYDEHGALPDRHNPEMITLERLNDEAETESLRLLVARHAAQTASPRAKSLLENWPAAVAKFWKVIPNPPTPETPKPVYQFPGELVAA